MQPTEQTLDLYFPIYGYTFNVVITDNVILSRQARDKKLDSVLDHIGDDYLEALHSYGHHPECYIFLKPTTTPGTIAHECHHGLSRMFRYIGGKEIDEEVMAYHLGYVVDRICTFVHSLTTPPAPTPKKKR